jgi:hypothetical protein
VTIVFSAKFNLAWGNCVVADAIVVLSNKKLEEPLAY